MAKRRWSHDVAEKSDALDLEANVFKKDSPRSIAGVARAVGRNVPKERKERLEKSKDELRLLYVKK